MPDRLVGVAELAEACGVKPDTIHKWRARHDDFPAPIAELAMGPVWLWGDVRRWLDKTGRDSGGKR